MRCLNDTMRAFARMRLGPDDDSYDDSSGADGEVARFRELGRSQSFSRRLLGTPCGFDHEPAA